MEFCFSPDHLHKFFFFEIEIQVLPIKHRQSNKLTGYLSAWSQFYLICDKTSIFLLFIQKVICVGRWAKFQVSFLLLILSLFQSSVKLLKKITFHMRKFLYWILIAEEWCGILFSLNLKALVTALCLLWLNLSFIPILIGLNVFFPFIWFNRVEPCLFSLLFSPSTYCCVFYWCLVFMETCVGWYDERIVAAHRFYTTSDTVFKQCMKLNESKTHSVCKQLCKILFYFALWNQTFICQMKSS